MKYIDSFIFTLLFCILSYAQNPCPGVPTVDYGDKTYHTVQVGNQCWLKENLDIGTRINGSLNQTNNSIIEKYCHNDDTANCTTYGGLYQWDEAMQYDTTEGTKGICPTGWHIPTSAEFQALSIAVNGDGYALRVVGQGSGTNTSGFSALLAGDRYFNGAFANLGYNTYFWSSSENNALSAYCMNLYYNDNYIHFIFNRKEDGFSVRCAKNGSTGLNDHSNNTEPKSIELFQNYPNPFNPSTTIKYSIAKQGNVMLTLYNTIGSKVASIVNEYKHAGSYSVQFNTSNLPSGVYFYRIQAESFIETKKMMLLK